MEPRIKDPPQARGIPEHGLLRNIREGFLEEVSQELREMSKNQLVWRETQGGEDCGQCGSWGASLHLRLCTPV